MNETVKEEHILFHLFTFSILCLRLRLEDCCQAKSTPTHFSLPSMPCQVGETHPDENIKFLIQNRFHCLSKVWLWIYWKCWPHVKISTHQTCIGQNTFTRNDQDQNQQKLFPLRFCPSSPFLTLLWHWPKIFDNYSNRAGSYQSDQFHEKTQQFQALFVPPQAPRQRPIQGWLATWTLARSLGRHRPLADTAMCNCFGKIWEGETTKTWCHRQNSCLVSDSMQASSFIFQTQQVAKCGRRHWKPLEF